MQFQNLCIARDLFGQETNPPTLRKRIFAEEWATDSYQNVLLSLIQYPQFRRSIHPDQGLDVRIAWPDKLIIISHDFKRSRFMELHVPTIQPPSAKVEYIGIDPPFDSDQLAQVVQGDRLRGYGAWKSDLRGTGMLLTRKRLARGWDEGAFVRACINNDPEMSLEAKAQLTALVRGEEGTVWPT